MGDPVKLAPCPFCGSPATVGSWNTDWGAEDRSQPNKFSVACSCCGHHGPTMLVRDSAVAAWNRRAPAPGAAPPAEECQAVATQGDGPAERAEAFVRKVLTEDFHQDAPEETVREVAAKVVSAVAAIQKTLGIGATPQAPKRDSTAEASAERPAQPREPLTDERIAELIVEHDVHGFERGGWPTQAAAMAFARAIVLLFSDAVRALPKDWKLVPVEITGEMWSEGLSAFRTITDRMQSAKSSEHAYAHADTAPHALWKAMLAAAPPAPGAAQAADPLVDAARALLAAVDARHIGDPPWKYVAPWGELAALRAALPEPSHDKAL